MRRPFSSTSVTKVALATTTYVESNTPRPAATKPTENLCYKHTAGEDQNQYVRMAARISGDDVRFLALLEGENGLWTPNRKHKTPYWREAKTIKAPDGRSKFMPAGWYNDWGLCGTSDYYKWWIKEDPRFSDPQWQLEQCLEMFRNGTTFHSRPKIPENVKRFTCPNPQ